MSNIISDKKTIQVTVSGVTGSGKNTVALVISQILDAMGFETEIELSHPQHHDWHNHQIDFFNEFADEKIEAVKGQSKILVKEIQVIRSYF